MPTAAMFVKLYLKINLETKKNVLMKLSQSTGMLAFQNIEVISTIARLNHSLITFFCDYTSPRICLNRLTTQDFQPGRTYAIYNENRPISCAFDNSGFIMQKL